MTGDLQVEEEPAPLSTPVASYVEAFAPSLHDLEALMEALTTCTSSSRMAQAGAD